MKRTVNVILRFKAVIEDDKDGVPFAPGLVDTMLIGAARAIPGCTELLPGGLVDLGLDRASALAARRQARERSVVASGPGPKRKRAAP